MFRRIACGTLLITGRALAGCNDTTDAPSRRRPDGHHGSLHRQREPGGRLHAPVHDLHRRVDQGDVDGRGSGLHQERRLQPRDVQSHGEHLHRVFDNPAATQAFEFNATASTIGAYCVRIYDNGSVTTDGIDYTYTITVTHPQ